MKLKEKEILSMIEKIRKGEATKEDLKELLGGDKLYELFAQDSTVEIMLNQIIDNGKIHSLLEENGFDILEGLLNKKIVGDLSAFYCIKSEYIISLPKEEQEKMATCIAGDWKELHDMLVFLWSKGIMTEAVTTNLEDNYPMIQFKVPKNDIEAQEIIQQIYEQDEIDVQRTIYFEGNFTINLIGNDLYTYCEEGKIKKNVKTKEDIFEKAIESNIEWNEGMYERIQKYDISQENLEVLKREIEEEKDFILKLREAKKNKNKRTWELTSEEKARIAENSIDIASKISGNSQELDSNGTNASRNTNDQQESDEQEV